jgi:hypothetical protein
LCIRGATFDDLMQLMPLSSSELLKKYLFFLIDYGLISYNGQKQVYMIKDRGLETLFRIRKKDFDSKLETSWYIAKYKDDE